MDQIVTGFEYSLDIPGFPAIEEHERMEVAVPGMKHIGDL
jgi:hypothetical protein